MRDQFTEMQATLETILLTLLGVGAVIVIVLAALMIRDMDPSSSSQGGAYYVGFFALFVLGAIFSKYLTVMARRRDRRRHTDERIVAARMADGRAPRSGDFGRKRNEVESRGYCLIVS